MNSRRAPRHRRRLVVFVEFVESAFRPPLCACAALWLVVGLASVKAQVIVDGTDHGSEWTFSASADVVDFNVGQATDTTGVATIQGEGTVFNISGGVVGDFGTGTLNLENHAHFNSTGWMGVGVSAGGVGFVNVSGGGNLHVSQDFAIGNQPGGMGTVTLTGDGTFAGVDQNALVGWSGTGALNVQSGADFLVDRDLLLGQETADSEGEVTVDGTGSTMEILADSSVGNRGTGRLVVSNGARFDGNSMTVGSQAGGAHALRDRTSAASRSGRAGVTTLPGAETGPRAASRGRVSTNSLWT